MKKTLITEIIALLFIVLFLYTGVSKLLDYSVFRTQIGTSPVLKPVAGFIAWALPLAEFVTAALLYFSSRRLAGFWISLVMMVSFTIYIIVILNFSEHIPCSCGGVLEQLSWQQHLVFNGVFIVLAAVGIVLQRKLHKRGTVSASPLILQ